MVLVVMFFASSALAIETGDILNQQQIDNIVTSDLNTSDLGCQMDDTLGIQFFDGNYFLNYSCLNLFKNDANSFEVMRQSNFVTVSDVDITTCLSQTTAFICLNRVVLLFNGQVNEFIEIIKENLESFQTSNVNRQIIDTLEGVDLFS